MLLLTAAAVAQPVRLWAVQESANESPSRNGQTAPVDNAPRQQPEPSSGQGQDLGTLLQVLAVISGIAALAALLALRGLWPDNWRLAGSRARQGRRVALLPDVSAVDLDVTVAQARVALSTGQPGSAIVACWMRLEAGVAAAGWPRADAETSAEYVERVVAEVTVDPGAITDLAALYREARFSQHALTDADRQCALDALSRVESGLRSGSKVSA